MIPISLEFLNFSRVGLISYIFHGDLNNTLGIRHSLRETSLESISGGRPEREIGLCLHPLQKVGGISKSKNLDQDTCILFNTFVKRKLRNCKNFFNIEKI